MERENNKKYIGTELIIWLYYKTGQLFLKITRRIFSNWNRHSWLRKVYVNTREKLYPTEAGSTEKKFV
jgi:hypothetical protein